MEIREEHPSQQGLRLQDSNHQILQSTIREEHPSQQGLRHAPPDFDSLIVIIIREEHPSQQGLRREPLARVGEYMVDQRRTSITTRIKTG